MELIVGAVVGAIVAGAGVWLAVGRRTKDLTLAAKAELERIEHSAQEARKEGERIREEAQAAKAQALADAQVAKAEARSATEAAKREMEAEKEALARKAQVDAKEMALKARVDAEAALEKRRADLEKLEGRIEIKDEALEKRASQFDQRESELRRREQQTRDQEKQLADEESRYESLLKETRERLERAAGLSSDDAKQEVIAGIVDDANREAARNVKRLEEEANEEAEARAKRIVGIAIQRYAGEYTIERMVSTVHLQSDEQKGRIIGREGRNIRALEAATGIDIIIDDTPEAIVLAGYNPVRREVARRAIDELLKDGRIHPTRIEEVVHKYEREVESSLKDWGEKAAFELGISGLHPEIVRLMGSLRYRTSYTQNQWQHAIEVGFIVGAMAAEMKLNVKDARRAGFLHDLGKAVSHEVEGGHAVIGADIAKKFGEKDHIVHAIRAHHDDVKPESVLAHLVAAGDAISGARPGARSENLDQYVKRLEELERISMSFPGVEKAFAVQAGREMRVIVNNAHVSDEMAVMLSRDIARKVEEELTYPGQVRVTVIRETRAVGIAR